MKNLKITVNGVAYNVQVEEADGTAPVAAAPAAAPAPVVAAAAPAPAAEPAPAPEAAPAPTGEGEVIDAPMPGTIVSVNVTPGQSVKSGDVLVILEAMKMENEIMAGSDAVVTAVHVNKGDSVESGTPLVSLQ